MGKDIEHFISKDNQAKEEWNNKCNNFINNNTWDARIKQAVELF